MSGRPMYARIKGEAQVTWQTLLDAAIRYTAEAPVDELAAGDADRLMQAANNILIRLQEAEDKRRGIA